MSAAVVRLLLAWAALLALLAATLGAAYLPLGVVKPWVAYAVATLKTGLILWFFMEMRRADAIARFAVLAGFAWVLILLALSAADYLNR